MKQNKYLYNRDILVLTHIPFSIIKFDKVDNFFNVINLINKMFLDEVKILIILSDMLENG